MALNELNLSLNEVAETPLDTAVVTLFFLRTALSAWFTPDGEEPRLEYSLNSGGGGHGLEGVGTGRGIF